jgi:hypothetical protein
MPVNSALESTAPMQDMGPKASLLPLAQGLSSLAADYLTNTCRAVVLFRATARKRKQHELLEKEWRELGCYSTQEKNFGMVFEDFGMVWDGSQRRSKRLGKKKLIKYF